jgi:NADH-quinone oxidoreductase subunit N
VESYPLAIVAMVAAVVAAYLYLRIMVSMWLDEAESQSPNVSTSISVVVAVCSVAALVIGLFPSRMLLSLVNQI